MVEEHSQSFNAEDLNDQVNNDRIDNEIELHEYVSSMHNISFNDEESIYGEENYNNSQDTLNKLSNTNPTIIYNNTIARLEQNRKKENCKKLPKDITKLDMFFNTTFNENNINKVYNINSNRFSNDVNGINKKGLLFNEVEYKFTSDDNFSSIEWKDFEQLIEDYHKNGYCSSDSEKCEAFVKPKVEEIYSDDEMDTTTETDIKNKEVYSDEESTESSKDEKSKEVYSDDEESSEDKKSTKEVYSDEEFSKDKKSKEVYSDEESSEDKKSTKDVYSDEESVESSKDEKSKEVYSNEENEIPGTVNMDVYSTDEEMVENE